MLIGIVPGTCGPGHAHAAKCFFFPQTPNSCGIFQAQYVCVNPNYACKFMQGTYVRDPAHVEVDGGSL